MKSVILVLDGHILTLGKPMLVETISCLVVECTFRILIDCQGRTSRAAPAVDQMTVAVGPVPSETANPALIPLLFPLGRIQHSRGIERSDNLVTGVRAALRVFLAPGKVKGDVVEHGFLLLDSGRS